MKQKLAGKVAAVSEVAGQLDILHANAGFHTGGEVATSGPDAWERMLISTSTPSEHKKLIRHDNAFHWNRRRNRKRARRCF